MKKQKEYVFYLKHHRLFMECVHGSQQGYNQTWTNLVGMMLEVEEVNGMALHLPIHLHSTVDFEFSSH